MRNSSNTFTIKEQENMTRILTKNVDFHKENDYRSPKSHINSSCEVSDKNTVTASMLSFNGLIKIGIISDKLY